MKTREESFKAISSTAVDINIKAGSEITTSL